MVTYDGAAIRTYLNGVLDSSTAQTGAIDINSTPLYIGNSPGSPTEFLNGKIDELAIWDVALNDDEIRDIYSRQLPQSSGFFTSRVFDNQASTAWNGIRWKTVLPAGKVLVGDYDGNGVLNAADEEAAPSYDGITTSLSNGLKGLWRFDEGFAGDGGRGRDVRDYSGADRWLNGQGTTLLGLPGKFGQAALMDGTTGFASVSAAGFPSGASARTLSVWIKPTSLPASNASYAIAGWGANTTNQGYGIALRNNAGTHRVTNYGISNDSEFDFTMPRFVWSHIATTFDGTTARTYVNGKLIGSSARPAWLTAAAGDFVVGRSLAGASYFTGSIDETAVWDRAFSDDEVLGLYRRGGNRLNVQVRSCGEPTCVTGSPQWTGPSANSKIYFDESRNTALNGAAGSILPTEPRMIFSNFGLAVPNAVGQQRYFQYRVFMESDDQNFLCTYAGAPAPCSPELRSVHLGPDL